MKRALVLFRDGWSLTLPYFKSEDRLAGLSLLALLIGLNLAMVYLQVVFNEWNNVFYTALQERDSAQFWHQLLRFCWLAAFFIINAILQTYFTRVLQIRWREWLTQRFLAAWLDDRAYYRIQLESGGTDNPDQRISEDLRLFTEQTLSLSLGLLSAVVTLASFVAILWDLSGSYTFELFDRHFTLEGYMVWFALIYAVVGTWLTNRVGRKLVRLNYDQQRYEADFRFDLVRLRENADAIALDRGEANEKGALLGRFSAIVRNWLAIMRAQVKLTFFTAGYTQIAIVFPFLVASPRYFSGAMQLGGLMQTASAFGQVQTSLSFIVTSYSDLATWTSVIRRLADFRLATTNTNRQDKPGITVETADRPEVALNNVEIDLPSHPLLAVERAEFQRGHSTLITGASGVGKSTLFRAIAGIWPFGKGTIRVPADAKLMFLPQRPYLPVGTLRDALLYPQAEAHVSDEELREALVACQLPELAERLDEGRHWAQSLSGGEQQRLMFVRVLLQRPDWLFIDEATSALDENTEKDIYALIAARLPQTTVISIGHRSSLRVLHERHLVVERPDGASRARVTQRAASAIGVADNLPA
jgi:putative ATP-binding cassette transporter